MMKRPRDFRDFPPFLPENQKEIKEQQEETSRRNPSFQPTEVGFQKPQRLKKGISSKLDHENVLAFR